MLYLASQSPRRSELLQQIHVEFERVKVDVPEILHADEAPTVFVKRLAVAKARAGFEAVADQQAQVLGADTIVVIDDLILGKPKDKNDALVMLTLLSGRTHRVMTAVALLSSVAEEVEISISEVTFREISAEERELYWDSGEPADKAGSYAIQGIGAIFIKHLTGSYSGVMGLPLYETGKLLAAR